jgi:2-iminoacetate synthase ThiH
MNNLTEGEDYYFNEQGYIVLTAKYHLEKGNCCGNGCKHCPYQYQNVSEPKRSELLSLVPDGKEGN